MSLNFIDISSHQAGIDLEAIFRDNPLDGVIVKATEGLKYVNPYCDRWVQWLIKNNKPWGFYHFLAGENPAEEAARFVDDCKNYFGHGVPAADYEGQIVSSFGTYYLRRFLETVLNLTGVRCMVYCNLGTIQADVHGFQQIADDGFPLWLAQYASNDLQAGFLDVPWQRGSFYPFRRITMHQYSDRGRLNSYNGKLDLDLFYGDRRDWNRLAGKEEPEPAAEPAPAEEDISWIDDWIAFEQEQADIHLDKVAELEERKRKMMEGRA